MTKRVTSVVLIAALGFLVPINAHAFGLGKLELSSALNEPFKAEIVITALKGDDTDNLQVRLASKKEFDQAGIERNFLLTQLKFDVIEKAGKVKIAISSQLPIREPFIDFLLTATTTGSGRLIREYTVLLDPPKNVFKKPVTPPLSPITNNSFHKPQPNVSTVKNKDSLPVAAERYGPTSQKDTLWDIALKTRPDKSITVNQMMLALLKANPTAFQRANINGLKAGHTLVIPSKEDIYNLNKQQAVNLVLEQNSLWKNRNVRVKPEAKLTNKPVKTAKIAIQTDQVIDPATSSEIIDPGPSSEVIDPASIIADNARLKLVVPNDESSLNNDALSPLGAEKIKELSEQLTLAQETIEGQSQDTIDFKVRMDAMEEQMNTMRRLISLKDADLARLQSMLEQDKQSDEMSLTAASLVEDNIALVIQKKPVDEQLIAYETDELSSVDKWEALVGTGIDEDRSTALASSEEQITESTEANIDSKNAISTDLTASIEPIAQQISSVMGSDLSVILMTVKDFVAKNKDEVQIAAGVLLALLVGLFLFIRRMGPDDLDSETQQTDNINDQMSANIASTNIDLDPLSSSVDVPEVAASIDTASNKKTVAELIEQADKLVADTDYEQAMIVLDQAKQQEPNNQTILTKLLYILFKKGQKEPFVATANKLNIDKDSAEWAEIAKWGRELAPLNALFNLSSSAELAETDLNMDSLPLVKQDELTMDLSTDQDLSEPEQALPDTIEFNLDQYDTEKLDITDNSSKAVLNDTVENIEEPLSFDTPLSLNSDNENEEFDVALTFESETDSDDSVLSLYDEHSSLDESEVALVFEDPNERSTDADTLQDLSFELDLPSEPENDQSLSIDFTAEPLDLDVPTELSLDERILEPLQTIKSESEDDNLEFDIDAYDEIDEAETKLDLASAYADMGDPDGARSILEEVLNEGNDEQKTKAQALLNNLS